MILNRGIETQLCAIVIFLRYFSLLPRIYSIGVNISHPLSSVGLLVLKYLGGHTIIFSNFLAWSYDSIIVQKWQCPVFLEKHYLWERLNNLLFRNFEGFSFFKSDSFKDTSIICIWSELVPYCSWWKGMSVKDLDDYYIKRVWTWLIENQLNSFTAKSNFCLFVCLFVCATVSPIKQDQAILKRHWPSGLTTTIDFSKNHGLAQRPI